MLLRFRRKYPERLLSFNAKALLSSKIMNFNNRALTLFKIFPWCSSAVTSAAWHICDIWYITSIFGLINEETKLKYKTAHFKHLTANFIKLMAYHLCWCCICCLLDSVSKFVSLSISMKLLNRRWYTDLWNCLSSGIMELYSC